MAAADIVRDFAIRGKPAAGLWFLPVFDLGSCLAESPVHFAAAENSAAIPDWDYWAAYSYSAVGTADSAVSFAEDIAENYRRMDLSAGSPAAEPAGSLDCHNFRKAYIAAAENSAEPAAGEYPAVPALRPDWQQRDYWAAVLKNSVQPAAECCGDLFLKKDC